MRLYHITHNHKLRRILKDRLLKPSKAKGKFNKVWLCDKGAISSIIQHIIKRDGGTPEQYSIIEVEAPQDLKRNRHAGIYSTYSYLPVLQGAVKPAVYYLTNE